MADESEPLTIHVAVHEGAEISDRLRAALDNLAAAVAEEELGSEVEGFGQQPMSFKVDVGTERTGGKYEPVPLAWGCIGNYHDDETNTGTCWIQWD